MKKEQFWISFKTKDHWLDILYQVIQKKSILEDLYALGIKKSTLFQDLDSLSCDLIQKIKEMTQGEKEEEPLPK